ncbi:Zn-ribbon domain-containing OB-fold protein [Gordonia alkanivorans]|uniref:Zn-ribbon domain-containing OB-fold protein n=1 Tax=Gordonia alkanivorans TaxID=84096 RepID=UPI002447BD99|nr:OB-fold domain-containing protein [Gordonia alkanivorans]MDH3047220.1 OB-fold domain-containing protein [Gordonia alkanivorans]
MTTYFQSGLPTDRPVLDPETMPYWDAARAGRLVVPFCETCREYFWYPRGFCPRCGGQHLSWPEVSGHGEVYSYSIVRRAFGEWAAHTPFVIAWVTLDVGIAVLTNLIDCSQDRLDVGLAVDAVFESASVGDLPALRFTPRHNG